MSVHVLIEHIDRKLSMYLILYAAVKNCTYKSNIKRSIIRRRFWNTLWWSVQVFVTPWDIPTCQWNVSKVISVSSEAFVQQNRSKNKLYILFSVCACVYKQCQKYYRHFGQILFRVYQPYMVGTTLSVKCILCKKKFTRSVRKKSVHFNIDSGHFEFMSTSNYDDYKPRFVIPKLDFLKCLIFFKDYWHV